jgi:hypothetical protein
LVSIHLLKSSTYVPPKATKKKHEEKEKTFDHN